MRGRLALLGAAVLCLTLLPAPAAAATGFLAGAAEAGVTPPPWAPATDAAFTPACGPTAAAVSQLWTGPRQFQFEEPYQDLYGKGHYVPGDPYCDADANGRYEAPWLAGGSGQNRWPESADAADPISVQALVLALGSTRIALVQVDSIGLFNVTADAIRQRVRSLAPEVGQVLVASTHDESAPDPIGLWGPDLSDVPGSPPTPSAVSSGVDEYYLSFLADAAAGAVRRASASARPALLKLAAGQMPSNVQSCWSSYPYVDVQKLQAVQAVGTGGAPIFTLVNNSTHVETLAFSGVSAYTHMLSADWPGQLRAQLRAAYPGSVASELTGLIGSVETATVYEPESTQVVNVPGAIHDVAGNPDGCSSVYPDPSSGTPVADAYQYLSAYGTSLAHRVEALLAAATPVEPTALSARDRPVCLQLENSFFAAAFAAHLFPDRQPYAEPTCGGQATPATVYPGAPALFLKSDVALLDAGVFQVAYSPGEVFPFSEVSGPLGPAQMPFPTDCYNPSTDDYGCGTPLPMTPWISAGMRTPYRLFAGLGQDMIGYLFPPGNFVGDDGETAENPWAAYHSNHSGDQDRFGHGHADDAEAPGPHGGLAVTLALAGLVGQGQDEVLPGLYVDAQGRRSLSPFPGAGFSGAAGIVVREPDGKWRTYLVGRDAKAFADLDAAPDAGTAGTSYPYSVSTRGVVLASGRALFVDVFAGSA